MPADGLDERLRAELIALVDEDDRVRARLAADGSLFEGYHPEMEAVHRRNANALRRILASAGWPGRSRVGDDGASAAWRIVQHAIGEPDFMRACLPLICEAAEAGEADPAELARLEDRIRVFEGRPQLYGTQYDWDEEGRGMILTYGIESAETVAERRRAAGLPPLELRREAPADEPPPAKGAESRLSEMEHWAERVGWRKPGRQLDAVAEPATVGTSRLIGFGLLAALVILAILVPAGAAAGVAIFLAGYVLGLAGETIGLLALAAWLPLSALAIGSIWPDLRAFATPADAGDLNSA